MSFLSSLWRTVTDTIVPPRKTEILLRKLSLENVSSMRRPLSVGKVEAWLPYEDSRVQALIWELKYYDSSACVSILGSLLSNELPGLLHELLTNRALLIPIPLHPKRKRARGYNQTEKITAFAASAAQDLIEHAPDVLVRKVDTPRQTALSRAKRLHNVKGAFEVTDPKKIEGRVCIVVDDVVTTGSTLTEAGSVLTSAGAEKVILIALAAAG